MKAHYTKFETEEQFKKLAEKAGQLSKVYGNTFRDGMFGYDCEFNEFISYAYNSQSEAFYQQATYLPYEQYLEYLDKCIENAKK